jgi:type II secretory pathway component PulF
MHYEYVASTNGGQIVRGTSELVSREAVISDLEARGLIVVSVTQSKPLQKLFERLSATVVGSVSLIEKVTFVKHLSLMLRAGLTIAEALEILIEQAQGRRFRFILESMHNDVLSGETFASSLAKFPKVFPPYVVNVIAAGELSGTLEGNLLHLADQLTKEYELRSRVKSAMLYPSVVMAAALLIGYIFAIYVIPQVAALFNGLKGITLPAVTVAMLAAAKFLRAHTLSSFFGIFGGAAFIVWLLRQKFLAKYTHWVILRLPVVGKISRHINLARMAMVLGTLLRSGVDIITATRVTATVVENWHYHHALEKVAAEMMTGKSFGEALGERPDLFPKVVTRMIGVGERTGKLDDVLTYLADFYQLEVETAMRNLSTLLEPILLLFIGVVALLLAFSILMPIYSFVSSIRKI